MLSSIIDENRKDYVTSNKLSMCNLLLELVVYVRSRDNAREGTAHRSNGVFRQGGRHLRCHRETGDSTTSVIGSGND